MEMTCWVKKFQAENEGAGAAYTAYGIFDPVVGIECSIPGRYMAAPVGSA